jgi:hypothetical protein
MMKSWIEKPKRSLPAKLAVSNLRLCPLCESLNARSNQVCFVCGWHGTFIHDSRSLHTSLVLLLEQCPELAEEVSTPVKKTILQRMAGRIALRFESLKQRIARRFSRHHNSGQHLDLWI